MTTDQLAQWVANDFLIEITWLRAIPCRNFSSNRAEGWNLI